MKQIGRYQLRGELARGAMGIVYRAWDPTLEREVAVKQLLLASGSHSFEDIQRFRREARLGAALRHSGIVAVHEVDVYQGAPFLAMDLIEGESLGARLGRVGPMPARQAARVAAEVAEALAYAHQEGVLHRDIKPRNILLDSSGRAVLADFGLAKDVTGRTVLTESGVTVGTPAYMAPEQAAAQPVDASSDVYGLGATLYAMLAGHAPFSGDSLYAVLRAVRFETPAPFARELAVPVALEQICLRCLAKEPGKRFESAHELSQALREFLASGQRSRPRTESEHERTRLTIGVLAISGVVAGLALGVLGYTLGRANEPAPLARASPVVLVEAQPLEPELRAAALVVLAEEQLAKGELRQAESRAGQAIELAPELALAYHYRGQARAGLGHVTPALLDFEQVLRLRPGDADPLRREAIDLMLAVQRDASERGEGPVVLVDARPHQPLPESHATLLAAVKRFENSEFEAAVAGFDEAITLDPRYEKAYLGRGRARAALGDLEGARSDFLTCQGLIPPGDSRAGVVQRFVDDAEAALRGERPWVHRY